VGLGFPLRRAVTPLHPPVPQNRTRSSLATESVDLKRAVVSSVRAQNMKTRIKLTAALMLLLSTYASFAQMPPPRTDRPGATLLQLSAAQLPSANLPKPNRAELSGQLLNPAVWEDAAPLFKTGQWFLCSITKDEVVYDQHDEGTVTTQYSVFGVPATEVKVYTTPQPSGALRVSRVEVIFVEYGYYVLPQWSVASTGYRTQIIVFHKCIEGAERTLDASLAAQFGSHKSVVMGRTPALQTNVKEYGASQLAIRVLDRPHQLLQLTILRKEDAALSFLEKAPAGTASSAPKKNRAEECLSNVKVWPNGDRTIENIPLAEGGGMRGYCAEVALAMLSDYYHVHLTVDDLAARVGISDRGYSLVNYDATVRAIAAEGGLHASLSHTLPAKAIQTYLERGNPILAGFRFSGPRFGYLHQFATQHADDGQLLPPACTDCKNWLAGEDKTGGHALLIFGYNRQRGEVLLLDGSCFGGTITRMRIEEIVSIMWKAVVFEP